MGKGAGEIYMLTFGKLPREAVGVLRHDAEAVHAGVNLELHGDIFLAQFCGGCFESEKLFAAMNRRRQLVLEKIFFLAGPETAKNKNGSANPGLADLHAFTGGSYAEPVGTGLFKGLRDRRSTVSVSVPFNDAENLSRGFALFAGWIHIVADRAQISGERGERNFRPDGAADEIRRILIFSSAGHENS